MRIVKCTDEFVLLTKDETVLQGTTGSVIEVGRRGGIERNIKKKLK